MGASLIIRTKAMCGGSSSRQKCGGRFDYDVISSFIIIFEGGCLFYRYTPAK
jgi:hypothetical protein